MNRLNVDFRLYLITDRLATGDRSLPAVVEEALAGGVRAIQLREKDLSGRDLYGIAVDLRRLTARYGARLFINDRVDIALAVDADGVHLGAASMPAPQARRVLGPDRLIGISCHTLPEAVAAGDAGADFITFGPVFFTPSKAVYGDPVGVAKLAEAASHLGMPVFALGGISRSNIATVMDAGAHGIALISAVMAAAHPREEAESLLASLRGHDD